MPSLEDFDQAIKDNLQDAKVYLNRGCAKSELGQHQEAIEYFTRAIFINDQYEDAYCSRGYAKYQLSQYQEAINDYNRAMSASSWESILTKTAAASPGRRPRGTLVARIRVVDRLCGAFDC